MPKLTLAERLEKAAHRKAKAEQDEARLKKMQRAERTRRMIEIGGLAVKAGIDTLPARALYDRFLAIAEAAREDPDAAALWERSGARHFQEEEDRRVVAVARFPGKLDPERAAALRALGFRWNRYLKQWEGRVEFTDAAALVRNEGGEIEEVKGGR